MADREAGSWDRLARDYRDGEAQAIAQVATIVRRAVHARGFYIPSQDRPEVVQESLVQIWRILSDPDQARPDSFPALVRAVAYRRCVDWMRRHAPSEPIEDVAAPATDDPETRLLEGERARVGRWALEALDDRCRDLIRWHATDDLTFREIAEREGRLEKTVRNQMYKCLQKARDRIERMRRRERLGLDAFGEAP